MNDLLSDLEKSLTFEDSAEITKKMSDADLLAYLIRTDIRLSTSMLLGREAVIRLMRKL